MPPSAERAALNKLGGPCYGGGRMTKLEEIEKAVAGLAPNDLARFREWFETFDGARFDEKIERDAASGKLDRLADQAIADFRKGRAREL